MSTEQTVFSNDLAGIVVGETAISDVQGEKGLLSYRGIDVNDLIGVPYLHVVWMVLFGDWPTEQEKSRLKEFMCLHAGLTYTEIDLLTPAPAKPDQALVLTYFRGNGESGVFLATSDDGHRFTAVNEDKPVFTPPKWPKQSLTRDPSIVFHQDLFHMVWTSNWQGRVFGYATSPDLVKWSDSVMVTPFPASLPADDQPGNVWAPEIHRDPVRDDFFILINSSSIRVP